MILTFEINSLHHGQTIHPTESFISLILTSEAKNPPQKAKQSWRSGFFEKNVLIKVVQWPQKPLSRSNHIWAMTSDEQDMRPVTSAHTLFVYPTAPYLKFWNKNEGWMVLNKHVHRWEYFLVLNRSEGRVLTMKHNR